MAVNAVALLATILLVPTVESRVLFGRSLGPNCTARVELGECVTNPLFMAQDCRNDCGHVKFEDDDVFMCRRMARGCFARGAVRINGGGDGIEDTDFDEFVFHKCTKTCRNQYRMVEEMFAPNDLQILIHAMLPTVYSVTLLALLAYQLLIHSSNKFMLMLEKLKQSDGIASLADRVQTWLIFASENQEKVGGFGPKAVGRLFVCGYYVVEGSFMFGCFAILVYLSPRIGLQRTNPKLAAYANTGIFLYSAGEAFLTCIKGLLLGVIMNSKAAACPQPLTLTPTLILLRMSGASGQDREGAPFPD
jgi:hypothetical protein